MQIRNVLSLFDGISCGRVALERVGITFDNFYSSEIDKYAIAISDFHFPDNIKLGDINDWENWNIDFSSIDLIMAGFPCQPWSYNGKLQGIEDMRGKLIYPLIKILERVKAVNPNVKFIFENVKMKSGFKDFLTELIGVEPTMINSSLVSAQNRNRLYWTNIDNFEITPTNELFIKDIMENVSLQDKHFFYDNEVEFTGKKRGHVVNLNIKTHESSRRVYSTDSKCPTLTTMQGGHRHPKIFIGNFDSYVIRRITPLECERLQTLEDNYTLYGIINDKVVEMSNTQRYKTTGNGWTVKIIEEILKGWFK
jgi:DNA-cytosine methyltransferase